jgi:hypothetical protein
MATTPDDLWTLLRELIEAQKETERRFQETDHEIRNTDRQIRELGKQIGGLGEKFGSFTEGLALPSMERLLRQRFGIRRREPGEQRIGDSRLRKPLGPQLAGVALTAGASVLPRIIATAGQRIIDTERQTPRDDLRLGQVDQRRVNP